MTRASFPVKASWYKSLTENSKLQKRFLRTKCTKNWAALLQQAALFDFNEDRSPA
jgi:hypothetical protein